MGKNSQRRRHHGHRPGPHIRPDTRDAVEVARDSADEMFGEPAGLAFALSAGLSGYEFGVCGTCGADSEHVEVWDVDGEPDEDSDDDEVWLTLTCQYDCGCYLFPLICVGTPGSLRTLYGLPADSLSLCAARWVQVAQELVIGRFGGAHLRIPLRT